MTTLFRRLRWWLQRRQREAELREELAFHLSEETDDRRADGLTDEDAARAARRDLGNATLVREDARALWSWVALEQAAQDIRYAIRGMLKNRAFTALAALSLALGIGANTAIYSFMHAILFRPLPVSDPSSLVLVKWLSQPTGGADHRQFVMHSGDGRTYEDGGLLTAAILPYPAFERLQAESASVMSSLFARKAGGTLNLAVRGAAELARGEYVSGDFFHGLSVVPAAGRLIQPDDDRAGAPPVAVLSFAYAERRFGAAASAIGQSVLVNNAPFTVVGVAPPRFAGVDPAVRPDVYLPMRADVPQREQRQASFRDPNYYWLEILGRLKPGVDLAQAQAALAGPFAQWVSSTAGTDGERANLPALYLEKGDRGLDTLRREFSMALYVLFAIVGLILAVACANTANLLLARAVARTREMTVRLSLGASRWRLFRQLLTESVLLATLSGALGILVAVAGINALTRLLANGQTTYELDVTLNRQILFATLALSTLCGLLFGLAPALQSTRTALMPHLGDRSVPTGAPRFGSLPGRRAAQVLVVGQIAISLLLLVAASLFTRTLANLHAVALGFNRENLLLFELNAPQAGYDPARTAAFYADLRQRLGSLPGVRGVTLSHSSIIRAGRGHPVTVDGQSARARILWTGPEFFTTMQIPIERGREISDLDRPGTVPVCVVSRLFAKNNFGNSDPIGRRLEVGGSLRTNGRPLVLEVVGVAADVHYGGLRREPPPVVYVPYAQVPPAQLAQMTYAVRAEHTPLNLAVAVRETVRQADAHVPVTNLKTQEADIDETIGQEILFARLCGAFALLGLTISCVGLYATMAYAVARRTGEIGIRMALGAQRAAVVRMVLREVTGLTVAGLALGLAAALAATRLIAALLFGTTPNDPGTLAFAAAILTAAALVAGYGPARRASRVDPLIALRHE